MGLEFKKDPYLLAFAIVIVLCGTVLVLHKDVSLSQAITTITAALLAPGMIGKKEKAE